MQILELTFQDNKKNQKPVKDEHMRRLDDLCDDIRSIILDRICNDSQK